MSTKNLLISKSLMPIHNLFSFSLFRQGLPELRSHGRLVGLVEDPCQSWKTFIFKNPTT